MKFDVVVTNPPFEDTNNRGKTQHKIWIDFTKLCFSSLLKDGGLLCQVSPSSFMSPSSKVLQLFKQKCLTEMHLDISKHFPNIGSSFAYYNLWNKLNDNNKTTIYNKAGKHYIVLTDDVFYIPCDFCKKSFSIHKKVIFKTKDKLSVKKDYVTCHNILLKKENSILSKTKTAKHIYPIFHTNKQIWYSSKKQDFSNKKKVMWTRSGYTKPFYDAGIYGITDMGYYILVDTEAEGKNLSHNLNLKLFKYIFKTAKWSGFGNEKIFSYLPVIPFDKKLTDKEMFDFFKLTKSEKSYVEGY